MRISLHITIAITAVLLIAGCEMGHTADPEPSESEEEAAEEQVEVPSTPADIPEFDGDRSVEESLEDARLATAVRRALLQNRRLRAFDFETEAEDGYVLLKGDVDTRDQYDRAARTAGNVDGVEGIVNEVTIEGETVSDSE